MPTTETQFLINPYDEPVVLRVLGKASFLNCGPIKDLFPRLLNEGKRRFVIDFQSCTGMDSTFLGILAGLAMQLRRADPPGSLVLTRLGPRNTELITNLGLHRILVIDEGQAVPSSDQLHQIKGSAPLSELENARMVLQAHENLVAADDANKSKFQDVISFLKMQIDS